jgi:hypothetical protein
MMRKVVKAERVHDSTRIFGAWRTLMRHGEAWGKNIAVTAK